MSFRIAGGALLAATVLPIALAAAPAAAAPPASVTTVSSARPDRAVEAASAELERREAALDRARRDLRTARRRVAVALGGVPTAVEAQPGAAERRVDALTTATGAVRTAAAAVADQRTAVESAEGSAAAEPSAARLRWPTDGAATSEFGPRDHPVSGGVRQHAGLDIGAPSGTAVVAAADGTVSAAEEQSGYGLVVIVDHGDGITTRYAHLSAIGVAVGDAVTAGHPLGAVGSTGTATGPHLHFEVRDGDEPVDPRERLAPPAHEQDPGSE